MSPTDLLVTSALFQAAFGVLLGWPLAALRAGWLKREPVVGKRLLQCHLDNLFMAALQFGAAATVGPPFWVAALIVVGSWTNAQLFLIPVFRPNAPTAGRLIASLSVPSFLITTVGWLALAFTTAPLLAAG